jgi:hypothetical protein
MPLPDASMNWLTAIPLWLWALLPGMLSGATYYAITKNSKNARMITIGIIVITSLLMLFLNWQVYLNDHFVGTFDANGAPGAFSRSGWRLLIDGWPLWLFPTLFVIALAWITQRGIQHWLNSPTQPIIQDLPPKASGPTSTIS